MTVVLVSLSPAVLLAFLGTVPIGAPSGSTILRSGRARAAPEASWLAQVRRACPEMGRAFTSYGNKANESDPEEAASLSRAWAHIYNAT